MISDPINGFRRVDFRYQVCRLAVNKPSISGIEPSDYRYLIFRLFTLAHLDHVRVRGVLPQNPVYKVD